MAGKLDSALAAQVHALKAAALLGDENAPPLSGTVKVLIHVTGELAAAEAAGFVTEISTGEIALGTAAVADLERIAALDDVERIESNGRGRSLVPGYADGGTAELSAWQEAAAAAVPDVDGSGVVLGIIDTGIDIHHAAFRRDGHTSITALVDFTLCQTVKATEHLTAPGMRLKWNPPKTPFVESPREVIITSTFPTTSADVEQAWLSVAPEIGPGDVRVTGGPFPANPLTIRFGGKYNTDVTDSRRLPDIVCEPFPDRPGSAQFTVSRSPLVFDRAAIDEAVRTQDLDFPFRDPEGHGTSMASIASGVVPQNTGCLDPKPRTLGGMAPGADLIVARTTFTDDNTIRATTWLFDYAAQHSRPVVVSMSFGTEMGPHDGTTLIERFLDGQLAGTKGRAIVVAAGNEGGFFPTGPLAKLPPLPRGIGSAGLHARTAVAAGGDASVDLIVGFGDHAMDTFEIWYAGASRLGFSLTAPQHVGGHTTAPPVGPSTDPVPAPKRLKLDDHLVTVFSALNIPPSGKHHIYVTIEPPADPRRIAKGTWKIRLHETAGAPTQADCWVFGSGDDPVARIAYEQQDQTRTLDSPACAHFVLSVGAYNPQTLLLYSYSSRGPTTDGRTRPKPEVCAPGVGIWAATSGRGRVSTYAAHNGTSCAVPYVAGVAALMFAVDADLTYDDITRRIQESCDPPVPHSPPEQLDSGWGYGRVNPQRAVERARGATPADSGPVLLPPAAYPALSLPTRRLAAQLRRRAEASAAGRTLAELVSRHAEEVRRLVSTERRVTVAWHRMHGPSLLRWVLGDPHREVLVPRVLGGTLLTAGLGRLLDELSHAGSSGLRADIAAHRALALALPGVRLADLAHDETPGEVV
ncbi:S8 family serine peptidase [Streptomyces sp. NPDC056257]|uniref:S8 family serine peptidase n=1 Tax=Streptomyces sp. NPDC056257 TaxID=3345765 RepID=UPI0035D8E4EF